MLEPAQLGTPGAGPSWEQQIPYLESSSDCERRIANQTKIYVTWDAWKDVLPITRSEIITEAYYAIEEAGSPTVTPALVLTVAEGLTYAEAEAKAK